MKLFISVVTTLVLLALCSNSVNAQGALTDGSTYTGNIAFAGDSDTWSFTATNGDSVVLRVGTLTSTNNFETWLRVYGPDSTLLGSYDPGSLVAAEVTFRVTNSGTFTVLVGDGFFYNGDYGDAGTYQLSYVKTPGALVISPGQEGGPLTNGTLNAGIITVGDIQAWSFTANTGDSVVLRAGKLSGGTSFQPWLRVYGPDGTFVGSTDPGTIAAAEVTFRVTNSGTFTVLVGDGFFYNGDYGDAGTYQLSYVKTPGALVISPGQEGGPLTNGTLNAGTITVGALNAWSFTATNGDSVLLRAGMLSQTTGNFQPWLRVYGPDGTFVGSTDPESIAAAEVTFRATNSGTFTVVVADGFYYNGDYGDAGTYQLSYDKAPGTLVVSPGEEGGPLTNGTLNAGTITVGDIQAWSFTANAGDSVVLRAGKLSGGASFQPWLRVYGPDGTFVGSTDPESIAAAEVTFRATNSGTFTVVVADGFYYNGDYGDAGTYQLSYDKAPGTLVVSPGEEGGPLTNGTLNAGTITVGDIQAWSFTANAGDSVVLRAGKLSGTDFEPWLRVYGPDGTLLGSTDPGSSAVAEVTLRATNSGTFTVLVTDGFNYNGDYGDAGTYQLDYVKVPGSFAVPPGDQGGPLAGVTKYFGTITLADIDVWSFTACQGDSINLQLNTTNFYGNLQLYGPNGVLLQTATESTDDLIAYTATNCGTFTVLVSSSDYDGYETGTYGLTVNGLTYGFKTCSPLITGTSLNVSGVGGTPGTNAVLFTTTNIANPALWTPIRTNPFDQFGVFQYTNGFNPAEPKRFFRLSHP